MIRSVIYRHATLYAQHVRTVKRLSTSTRSTQRIRISRTGGHEFDLDVYEPVVKRLDSTSFRSNIVLYFSRGPLLDEPQADERTLDTLGQVLPTSHILHVRYELGSERQFPQPVYDAVSALDWTVEHLLPERSIKRPGRADHVGQITTCGELIGGSLATMLALTECKKGQVGISAAAVNNPLVDWTDIEEQSSRQRKSRTLSSKQQTNAVDLTEAMTDARSQLFGLERDHLDAFASPMLFFRSAGLPDPPTFHEGSSNDEAETLGDGNILPLPSDNSLQAADGRTRRKARYSYQFPNRSLMLQLPAFHISTGSSEPLQRQGVELVDQLKKSVLRQHRSRRRSSKTPSDDDWIHDHEEREGQTRQTTNVDDTAIADSRIVYSPSHGLGLWDDTSEGQASLMRTAQWLKARLGAS